MKTFERMTTTIDTAGEYCLHEAFEVQAEGNPQAVALILDDVYMTYRELNSRANQLARVLRRHGVGPDVLVGVYMERSLDLLVGLLAILKAGGAYVPLDPACPQERLEFLLEDARLALILTHQQLRIDLNNRDIPLLCLDTDWQRVAQESPEKLPGMAQSSHLAYVIYTSGSTGKPKGVMVTHASVLHLFQATHAWYQFDEHDTWTLFHSYAFDFSVWEIWGALLYGGRLVIVPYRTCRSPEDFYHLLLAEQVTVLNQTPGAFRQFMHAERNIGQPGKLALRYVIFGGEALELQSLKPWFQRYGDQQIRLVNMYGITETTVHATYRPLTLSDLESNVGSVIGKPLPHMHIYLLDQHRQPVSEGQPGEMYIGGTGVARGYLHQAGLTRERFIDNPFDPTSTSPLYKSGDLARYRPDGDLEFLGRVDQQVKVRGYRVEPGEIEAALLEHPQVHEVAVLLREDQQANRLLVAYIVSQVGQTVPVAELRRFLQNKLPIYMLPAAYVLLAALPLTINGKLDRQALPDPDWARREIEATYVAPRTPLEKVLATIWSEVLELEQVGIYDNFFEVGGDSLLAVHVISSAREALDARLPLSGLLDAPTVASLAERIAPLLQAEADFPGEQNTLSA